MNRRHWVVSTCGRYPAQLSYLPSVTRHTRGEHAPVLKKKKKVMDIRRIPKALFPRFDLGKKSRPPRFFIFFHTFFYHKFSLATVRSFPSKLKFTVEICSRKGLVQEGGGGGGGWDYCFIQSLMPSSPSIVVWWLFLCTLSLLASFPQSCLHSTGGEQVSIRRVRWGGGGGGGLNTFKAAVISLPSYSLVQCNWFSDITGCL